MAVNEHLHTYNFILNLKLNFLKLEPSVWEPKRLFPDPDPTFQIIPAPDPAPDPTLVPGPDPIRIRVKIKFFKEHTHKKNLHIIQRCLELDCCTVFPNF